MDGAENGISVQIRVIYRILFLHFLKEGVFPVTLKYYNAAGCTEEITKNVSTYPLDYCNFSSSFTILKDTVQKGKVYFTGTTTPQFDNLKYKWSFGDGSLPDTSKNPVHMYNTGKFNVCLEITREEQCLISYCDTVSIEPSGQNFQLYPNPVSDEIKIVIDAPSPGQYVINIISAQGGEYPEPVVLMLWQALTL